MTVAELIKALQEMPQDAEVRYYDDFYSMVEDADYLEDDSVSRRVFLAHGKCVLLS